MRLRASDCRRMVWGLGAIPFLASSALAQAPAMTAAPKTAHPAAAAAPTAKPKAPDPKKALASAEKKREAGDFTGALEDYTAADSVAPSPATVEGIAFCHDKLGQLDEALTWYEGFLSNVPVAMQERADAATARVAAIKAMPGHLRLESLPTNALVTVDGKEAPTHTPIDLDLAPGKHLLHVTAPDYEAVDKEVDIVSRQKANVALELLVSPPPPAPVVAVAPPPPPPPPPPPHSLIPAYVTGGLALVAAGIGTGFGIAALNDKSNFNKNPTTATANDGEDHALVSDMGFGIALTLGVTSVILFTTKNEQSTPAPAAHDTPAAPAAAAPAKTSDASPITFTAAPFMTSHGGGAGAVVRF